LNAALILALLVALAMSLIMSLFNAPILGLFADMAGFGPVLLADVGILSGAVIGGSPL
jgi:hypothetical protein